MKAFIPLLLAGLSIGMSDVARAEPREPRSVSTEIAGVQPTSPIERLQASWRDSMKRIRQIEWVENATAVLNGSQLGPGDGWFHPGKSRYGWKWLAERCDRDGDQVITAEEFSGPTELFQRLDRDKNGELKADDFDWSENSPFVRQQLQTGSWFSRIDKSSNGRITGEEWQQFFDKLAGEKGYVSREDLRLGLFPPPPPKSASPPSPGQEGPTRGVLLVGMLTGELGSMREGPGIDQEGPDFELETQDHRQRIRLSAYRDQKPVVLVFGSFT